MTGVRYVGYADRGAAQVLDFGCVTQEGELPMKCLGLFLTLALLFMAGCSTGESPTAPPDGADQASLARAVPIKGSFQTTFQLIPIDFEEGIPVRFSVPTQGTGRVSHLGNSTVTSDQVIDFTADPPTLIGTTVFIAANGDELHATHAGITGVPDAAGNSTFSGVFTFVGGTGRFSDASGSATFTGVASVETLAGSFSLRGTIGY